MGGVPKKSDTLCKAAPAAPVLGDEGSAHAVGKESGGEGGRRRGIDGHGGRAGAMRGQHTGTRARARGDGGSCGAGPHDGDGV